MGTALWLACGLSAFLLARIVPLRRRGWLAELAAGLLAALAAGLTATALDFGGWNEPDWRSGAFALLVAFAGVAVVRLFPRKP